MDRGEGRCRKHYREGAVATTNAVSVIELQELSAMQKGHRDTYENGPKMTIN